MMRIRTIFLWAGVAASVLFSASAGRAQTEFLAYDNLSTLSSLGPDYLFVYPNASATVVGKNIITGLVADDIKCDGVTDPFHLKSFSFYVTNTNDAPVTVRPLLRIWDDDRFLTNEVSDVPGTLFQSLTLPLVTLPAAPAGSFSSVLVNYRFPAQGLNITFDGKGRPNTFYAGLVFDNNNGGTKATLEQMNGVGLLINDIANDGNVIVGASGDVVWKTNTDPTPGNQYYGVPGPDAFNTANPPGFVANFFGENQDPLAPYTNTAMRFTVINGLAAPEPGTFALLALGLAVAASPTIRRRKS